MTNSVDSNGLPGIATELYLPDQLLYGQRFTTTSAISIPASQGALARGTVMGQQTLATPTSAAKSGGNTGTGTVGSLSLQSNAIAGKYLVRFTAATVFTVTNPLGEVLSTTGATGVAFANEIGFTITAGGTAFVAGDGFDITVAAGANTWIPSVLGAVDGSQIPAGILVFSALNSGSAQANAVYSTGEFNSNALVVDQSWAGQSSGTLLSGEAVGGVAQTTNFNTAVAALAPLMQSRMIILRAAVQATGPNYPQA